MVNVASDPVHRLREAAREAQGNAYAPYSGTKIGAALETGAGDIYTGCNVENASYGLTICAERAAVFIAVASVGPALRIARLAVVRDDDQVVSPCGACRHVIMEFGRSAQICYQSAAGPVERDIEQLLPDVASPDDWLP